MSYIWYLKVWYLLVFFTSIHVPCSCYQTFDIPGSERLLATCIACSWEWEIVGDMYCMFLGVRDSWRHVLHAGKSADGWMVLFFALDSRWRPGNQQNCKIVLVTYNDMIVNFIYYIQYHKIVIINTLTSVNFQIFHYTRIWDYVDPMIIVNML